MCLSFRNFVSHQMYTCLLFSTYKIPIVYPPPGPSANTDGQTYLSSYFSFWFCATREIFICCIHLWSVSTMWQCQFVFPLQAAVVISLIGMYFGDFPPPYPLQLSIVYLGCCSFYLIWRHSSIATFNV